MDHLAAYYVDKQIPIPLYYQLKQHIIKLIEDGVLQVGDMLPTENEFCEHLGISRPTIRQALKELVNEGFLVRHKSKGTFVAQPKIEARFFQKLESFNDEMRQKGLTPTTKVMLLEKTPGNESVSPKLYLPLSEPLIHLVRLRFADNEPVVYVETYLPYNRFPALMDVDFTSSSMYEQLEKLYGEHVNRVHREIEAVNSRRDEAELLQTKLGKAVCLVKTIAYTEADAPVEYSVARYRGDRNKFSVDLYR